MAIPEGIVAADFDGDDQPDLATANRGTNNVYSQLGGLIACQRSYRPRRLVRRHHWVVPVP